MGSLDGPIWPGTIADYAGDEAPPGWLLCYGQAVSRMSYPGLFGVIKTRYGAGDGVRTFNVPDLRGRVVAGKDDMGGTSAGVLGITLTGTTTDATATVTGLSSTTGLAAGMLAFGSTLPDGVTIASIDSATQVTLSTGVGVTAGTTSIRFGVMDANTLGANGGSQTHALSAGQIPPHQHSITPLASTALYGAGALPGVNINSGGTIFTNTGTFGGNQGHPNVQPTQILNKIIKV